MSSRKNLKISESFGRFIHLKKNLQPLRKNPLKSPIILKREINPIKSKLEYRLLPGDCEQWFEKLSKLYDKKVKLIYLDPPYNTKRNRGARSYYSDNNRNWSEFMLKVLRKSYDLLAKKGFLVVSINQTEIFNLKNIADKIFVDGFIGIFPIKIRHQDRQLMINATFHNVYEYFLVFRKQKTTRFNSPKAPYKSEKFCYRIKILDNNPTTKVINTKHMEIYKSKQYTIIKANPSKNNFRKYSIVGKIATANWSGHIYDRCVKDLGSNKLVKVYGLDHKGLGYRWFLTPDRKKLSGKYFQHAKSAGRLRLFTNYFDFTDIATNVYKEGGLGCDYKDSKKPELLINEILEMTTSKNDLVMDFFGGSGTTLACCIKKNRSCIVIEKSKPALNAISQRMKNLARGKDQDLKKYQFKVFYHHLNHNVN